MEGLILPNNKGFEILTPNGFRPFVGLRKTICDSPLKLTFSHKEVIATRNHIFIDKGKKVEACDLRVGDVLNGFPLLEISETTPQSVYDPIQVFDGNEYIADGIVSHNCDFLGSSATLLSARVIQNLAAERPLYATDDGLRVYERPVKEGVYVTLVDTAEGVGGDSSAFSIVRVDQMPYKVVMCFSNSLISPLLYPNLIYKWSKEYNESYVLVEINKSEQVPHILHYDLEYENMIYVGRTSKGQVAGSAKGTVQFGVKQDKKTKRTGCLMLRDMAEEGKIEFHDAEMIGEASTFIETNGKYAADDGYHDDLIMTLVLFGWLVSQEFFKEITDIDVREKMYKRRMEMIEEEMLPDFKITDGTEARVNTEGWVDYTF